MTTARPTIDPKLDLVLERDIDVPRELVWKAWTTPEHLKKWFAPAPWTVAEVELDLRPGGIFRVVMRSPEGDDMPAPGGCVLEVVPNERLVWTDALGPGFRPAANPFFTAIVTLEARGTGTRYVATAVHGSEETRRTHEEMGFRPGWCKATDQLVELVTRMW